ncbi:MAG: MerR family transcriptional regulator [Bacteroidales bacterium]|nr:MerR family transcriptional regulator [Bacteroidales bacterium]MBN2748550.1 MerR family transcriptional regulator [Bacteroidales bacterium]
MGKYSIKDVETLTGIKAHTIRIWEKRFNLFNPSRTDTNIRKYSDEDIRLALNISLLQQKGFKISQIARMNTQQVDAEVKRILSDKRNGNIGVEAMLIATSNFNESDLKQYIERAVNAKGVKAIFTELISPFLTRIGALWQAGVLNPAQEHFASNIIKEYLFSQLNRIEESTTTSPLIIFYLPEGEFHEITLLYSALLSKMAKYRVIYLGQTVPLENLIATSKNLKPWALFTSISKRMPSEEVTSHFTHLKRALPSTQLLATGYQVNVEQTALPSYVTVISSQDDLDRAIPSL